MLKALALEGLFQFAKNGSVATLSGLPSLSLRSLLNLMLMRTRTQTHHTTHKRTASQRCTNPDTLNLKAGAAIVSAYHVLKTQKPAPFNQELKTRRQHTQLEARSSKPSTPEP